MHYLVCNSVPKSGTHLLLEIAKVLGFSPLNIHFHDTYATRRIGERSSEPTPINAATVAAAMPQGSTCTAHFHYSEELERAFLARPEHRMLFIIRDPRDIVVSRVDFVQSPVYAQMTEHNSKKQELRRARNWSDSESISREIETTIYKRRLLEYVPWLTSPACLIVRFEHLHSEIVDGLKGPAIASIASYLDKPIDPAILRTALGKGMTESGRAKKIGIYRDRMNAKHLKRIEQSDFQAILDAFGY